MCLDWYALTSMLGDEYKPLHWCLIAKEPQTQEAAPMYIANCAM